MMTNKKLLKMRRLLPPCGLLALLLGSAQAGAAPLQVGPLSLGMTNAQVIKFTTLSGCKLDADRMVCVGTIDVLGTPNEATLKFNPTTKRLEWIELRLNDWTSDDARLPELYSKLNFHQCRPDMVGSKPDWFTKEECFEAPNQVRRVTWDGGHIGRHGYGRARSINVAVFVSNGFYKTFLRKKAEEKKQAHQAVANDNFARGK
jgi:hypothetical protein